MTAKSKYLGMFRSAFLWNAEQRQPTAFLLTNLTPSERPQQIYVSAVQPLAAGATSMICQVRYLSGGEGGGSKPTRLSRWSGTYSWTSTTLLMMLRSSCIAGMSGEYFHSPSTMNLYCTGHSGVLSSCDLHAGPLLQSLQLVWPVPILTIHYELVPCKAQGKVQRLCCQSVRM